MHFHGQVNERAAVCPLQQPGKHPWLRETFFWIPVTGVPDWSPQMKHYFHLHPNKFSASDGDWAVLGDFQLDVWLRSCSGPELQKGIRRQDWNQIYLAKLREKLAHHLLIKAAFESPGLGRITVTHFSLLAFWVISYLQTKWRISPHCQHQQGGSLRAPPCQLDLSPYNSFTRRSWKRKNIWIKMLYKKHPRSGRLQKSRGRCIAIWDWTCRFRWECFYWGVGREGWISKKQAVQNEFCSAEITLG